MGLRQKVISGSLWQLFAVAANTISSLIVVGVLARIISPESFGLISMTNSVMVFAQMFTEIGIEQYIIRTAKMNKTILNTVFWLSFFFALLMYLILFLAAPIIAAWYYEPSLIKIIRILSLTLIISRFGRVSHAIMQKELLFKKIVIMDIISYIFGYATVGIILALNNYGVWSIVYAKVCQTTLQSMLYYSNWPNKLSTKIDNTEIKKILHFGSGLITTQTIRNIAQQADYFIVGRYMGSAILGQYERSFHIMTMPVSYLGNIFDKVFYSAMSKIQDNKEKIIIVFEKTMRYIFAVSIPIQLLIFLTSKQIVLVLLGENWVQSYPILQILSLTIVLRASAGNMDALFRLKNVLFNSARIKLIFMFFVIVFSLIGAFFKNIRVVCIGINIAFILNYFLMLRLASNVNQTNHFYLLIDLFKRYTYNLFPFMCCLLISWLPFVNNLLPIINLFIIIMSYLLVLLIQSWIIPCFEYADIIDIVSQPFKKRRKIH